jgi:Glyoxalase-like domain
MSDPRRLAPFSPLALGYVGEPGYDEPDGASIIDPDDTCPAISFLTAPEPKMAKNRLHIYVRVADEPPSDMTLREHLIPEKATELVAAGATTVHEHGDGKQLHHVVM